MYEKYPFWKNLVPKFKIVWLKWNFVLRLIWICRIHWWCSLFSFSTGSTLFGKIWSKKIKLTVQAEIWYLDKFEYAEFNDGVQFFCFSSEIPFLDKFGPKNHSCQFKLKFGTDANLNMENSMVMFTLSVFDRKNPFFGKFISKNWNCWLKLKFRT